MTKVPVKNGQFMWSTPLQRLRFFESAEGKEVRMEVQEEATDEMRKYFEGCLVPAFFYFHPHTQWKTFADAREAIKLEFSPGIRLVETLAGEWLPVAPSTTELGKKKFTQMVDSLTEWMIENGMPVDVLDSESYKVWRDSNYIDLVYPPLRRLKEQYDAEKKL